MEFTITIEKSADGVSAEFPDKVRSAINTQMKQKVLGLIEIFKEEFK